MVYRSHSDTESRTTPVLTPQLALPRIQRYCVYQERSHQEVKQKLFDFGLHGDEVDELVTRLITDGFLNEARFAKAFAGGKFRIKKWGRVKIEYELKHRGLTANCIQQAVKEIDTADYVKTLRGVLVKAAKATAERNLFKKRNKVARFAISKGYEVDLVWEMVKDLLPGH